MIFLFFIWVLIIVFGLRTMIESDPIEACIIIVSVFVIFATFVAYIIL